MYKMVFVVRLLATKKCSFRLHFSILEKAESSLLFCRIIDIREIAPSVGNPIYTEAAFWNI